MRFPCLKSTRISALNRPGLRVKKIIRQPEISPPVYRVWRLPRLFFPEDGCFDVKEDGQCNWIYIGEAVYVEEWKAGTKNGQGTYAFVDGRMYVGEWKDGNPWLGIEYD